MILADANIINQIRIAKVLVNKNTDRLFISGSSSFLKTFKISVINKDMIKHIINTGIKVMTPINTPNPPCPSAKQ